MIIERICRMSVVLIVVCTSLTGCAELLDGPFNQGGNVVPSLLYAKNGSDYVTYWDENTGSYRTFDQQNNIYLASTVFETESDKSSQNYVIVGRSVVPLTRLSHEEMAIQNQQGCIACHET